MPNAPRLPAVRNLRASQIAQREKLEQIFEKDFSFPRCVRMSDRPACACGRIGDAARCEGVLFFTSLRRIRPGGQDVRRCAWLRWR